VPWKKKHTQYERERYQQDKNQDATPYAAHDLLLLRESAAYYVFRITFSPFTHDYMGYAVLQVLPRAFRDDHPPLCSLSEEAKVH